MVASLETIIPMGLIVILIGLIASFYPLSDSEKARQQDSQDTQDTPSSDI